MGGRGGGKEEEEGKKKKEGVAFTLQRDNKDHKRQGQKCTEPGEEVQSSKELSLGSVKQGLLCQQQPRQRGGEKRPARPPLD